MFVIRRALSTRIVRFCYTGNDIYFHMYATTIPEDPVIVYHDGLQITIGKHMCARYTAPVTLYEHHDIVLNSFGWFSEQPYMKGPRSIRVWSPGDRIGHKRAEIAYHRLACELARRDTDDPRLTHVQIWEITC